MYSSNTKGRLLPEPWLEGKQITAIILPYPLEDSREMGDRITANGGRKSVSKHTEGPWIPELGYDRVFNEWPVISVDVQSPVDPF